MEKFGDVLSVRGRGSSMWPSAWAGGQSGESDVWRPGGPGADGYPFGCWSHREVGSSEPPSLGPKAVQTQVQVAGGHREGRPPSRHPCSFADNLRGHKRGTA